MISIFPLGSFHILVSTFQQHLYMEYRGGSRMFLVFHVKNHDFTPTKMIFLDFFLSAPGVCSSQWIRYSRECGFCHNFLDRGLLLRKKLLIQGFLVIKLKSSLQKFWGGHHDLIDRNGISVSQMTMYIFRLSQSQPSPFLIHDF